jgi:polyisoprenoid-binding protein YceI
MTGSSAESSLTQLSGIWMIDPVNSGAEFATRYAMVATVRGRFNAFSGTLALDPGDPSESSAEVEIKSDSIDTGDPIRDAHLKSPDFLDVDRFPAIRYRSTRAIPGKDPSHFQLHGELTIRDVTREVQLDVTFNGAVTDLQGNLRAGFEVEGVFNRKQWGLVWNAPLEAGGVLVGDRVRITLDISALKQPADPGM